MATVAGNSTVVSKHSLAITKSKWSRTAKVLAETEAAQQEAALLANELRDPGPSNDFVGKNKKGNGSARIGKRITRAIIHNYQNKEKEIQLLANELRDPIAIQPTYSMRSVKTSEGMKLNDFVSPFNTSSTEQYKNEQVVYFTECIVVHEADTTRIAHWLSSRPNLLVIQTYTKLVFGTQQSAGVGICTSLNSSNQCNTYY